MTNNEAQNINWDDKEPLNAMEKGNKGLVPISTLNICLDLPNDDEVQSYS